jgi:cysteine-rich repeat protein
MPSESAYQCGAGCGDAVVQWGEQCDDGNQVQTDSCLNNCMNATCGDGHILAGSETCDDANDQPFDGCGSDCNLCGDGVVGGYETCDDGNEVADDGCTSCVLDSCGNGQVDPGERCDGGDGCTNCCRLWVRGSTTISQANPIVAAIQNIAEPEVMTLELMLRGVGVANGTIACMKENKPRGYCKMASGIIWRSLGAKLGNVSSSMAW